MDEEKRVSEAGASVITCPGPSLEVQWLKHHAPTAGGRGSIPTRGTKSLHAAQQGKKENCHKCHRPELTKVTGPVLIGIYFQRTILLFIYFYIYVYKYLFIWLCWSLVVAHWIFLSHVGSSLVAHRLSSWGTGLVTLWHVGS